MARKEDEQKKRKKARKQGVREDRHKTRQDLRAKRAGALDKFAAVNQAKIQPAQNSALQEMADRGAKGGAQPQVRPPQILPAAQSVGAAPPVTDDQKYAIRPPQVAPPVPVAPQQATAMQPAQVFDASGQAATPDPVYQQAPPPQGMPPEVLPPPPAMPPQGMPPEVLPPPPAMPPEPAMMPPDQVDPATGEVAPMAEPPSVYTEPATPEEAAAQASMDQAQAQGTPFAFSRPPMTDAAQFQAGLAKGGTASAVNPRQMERMRRKRLALLNPKVQQLRPWGRGMPQIRYQGGPAFEGAFQPPQPRPAVRGERPQYRQPLAR